MFGILLLEAFLLVSASSRNAFIRNTLKFLLKKNFAGDSPKSALGCHEVLLVIPEAFSHIEHKFKVSFELPMPNLSNQGS